MARVRGTQRRVPGPRARRVRARRGRAARGGGAGPGVPRGGRVAEPRVARPRRRQARRRHAGQPVTPATVDGRGRRLLAALLREERHDRVLRAAGVGRVLGDGEPVAVRSGALERERVVHFETWAIEAVAASAGVTTPLPMGPFPERALRPLLHDTSALDRLERAREDVVGAPREHVAAALDRARRGLRAGHRPRAGRAPTGDSGGGRTIAYLDCMRDLDLTLGPAVLDELRASLPQVLAASRWWCGRVFDRGAELMERIAHGQTGPLAPLLGPLMGAGFGLWDQLGEEQARAAAPLGRRRRVRRLDAGVVRLRLPLGRPADRRGEHRRARARRLPDRARRLPRRRQPARAGPLRPAPSRPGGHAAPHRRRGRPGRPPLAPAPRRGGDDRAQLAAVPAGRHRRDERRRARARRAPAASRSRTSSSTARAT